jgi:hypothetical protein
MKCYHKTTFLLAMYGHLSGRPDYYLSKVSLIKENKKFQPNWHCCMCYNPANGRVDYEDGWLKKSSWIIKVQQKKKKYIKYKFNACFLLPFLALFSTCNRHIKPIFVFVIIVTDLSLSALLTLSTNSTRMFTFNICFILLVREKTHYVLDFPFFIYN